MAVFSVPLITVNSILLTVTHTGMGIPQTLTMGGPFAMA
jgi:hypothetical protein